MEMSEVPGESGPSLRELLRDWTEWDEAAYFLGKLIGILPGHYSFGNAKGFLIANYSPSQGGRKIVLLLNLLADIGVLEMRNNYQEFRWSSPSMQ
jgi:hypothetical protein